MWIILPILALTTALAACNAPPQASVDGGYVRLGAVPRSPAAAYFTVHGGPADTTLLSVSTDVAIKAEMHQSMSAGGMSTMKPLDMLPVPARSEVRFAPGGKHVMLFDVNPGVKPGRYITLVFVFSDGRRIAKAVPSIAAGAPAPGK